jgi:hypothetical protein
MTSAKHVATAIFALALISPVVHGASMLDHAIRTSFLPEFDDYAAVSVRTRPDMEYTGSEWVEQSRTVVGTYVVDLAKDPTYGDESTVAERREAGEEIGSQISLLVAEEKLLIVSKFCAMAALAPAKMRVAVTALRDFDITIQYAYSEANSMIPPYSVNITAADLAHCVPEKLAGDGPSSHRN